MNIQQSIISNQQFLLQDQYKDASTLDIRKHLFDRFGTNKQSFPDWVYCQIEKDLKGHVLELGCGPANLWVKRENHIPEAVRITLSDLSLGMVKTAQAKLAHHNKVFKYGVIDIQSIPFHDASCALVLANHMLYHVPNKQKAYSEIYRVLQPGCALFAAANGRHSMEQIRRLWSDVFPDAYEKREAHHLNHGFYLDEGAAELSEWFDVTIHRYDNGLVITEAEPLIAYILSLPDVRAQLNKLHAKSPEQTGHKISILSNAIRDHIAKHGAVRSELDVGIVHAMRNDIA